MRTPLSLLCISAALACAPTEDNLSDDDSAFLCRPSVRYSDRSVTVGDDVSLRPRIGCSSFARNRRFSLVPSAAAPLTYNRQFESRIGRGLEINPATGEILGTVEGWSGWNHDDANERAQQAPITATVRMCYTPRATITPQLSSVSFSFDRKKAFKVSGTSFTYAVGSVVRRVSSRTPQYRVSLPSSQQLVFMVDGLSFISEEEEPNGELQPVPAIAECDEVDPSLPRNVQDTLRLECRREVQRDIDACFGEADVNECVEERITTRWVEARRRPWDCADGQRYVEARVTLTVRDDDPLRVAAPYDMTPYTPGRYSVRRVTIGGGTPPYRFSANGLSHALRIRDDGSIAGKLYRWDGLVNATVTVRDADGRSLHIHYRPVTNDAQVLVCAGRNLGEPCEVLPRRGNEAWVDSHTIDLNAAYRNGSFPRANRISSLLVSAGKEVVLCDRADFQGECKVFGANGNRDVQHELRGTSYDDWAGSMRVRAKHPGAWYGYTNHGASVDDRVNSWSEEAQGITHNDTHWFVTNKWYIFRYPKGERLSSRNWDERRALPASCNHFGDPTWHAGKLYVPLEGCAGPNGSAGSPHRSAPNGDDRLYTYDADLNPIAYGVLNHQRQASWVAVDPHTGLIYSSDFDTGTINVYAGISNQRSMEPVYTVSLPYYVRGIQGGVISANGNLYLSTNSYIGPPPTPMQRVLAGRGILVFELRGGQAVPLAVRSGRVRNWIHPGFPDGAGMEMEGITLWDVRGENIPDVADGQIHYVILDNDWPSNDEIYVKHISVNQPSKL